MQYGFFQDMEKGTHEAATAAGYDYILVDEKSSESTMVSATIDLINQGISALVISPFKPDALGPIVDAAKAKGIPVVVDDIGGGGSAYDAIVISNNQEGGTMAAVQMDKLISAAGKPKKVASITCEASAVYAARRNVGFETKIKALGYTVVATLSGNSQQEQGYKVMQDILAANPDVSGVFSCNDPLAVGAAQAVKDAGKSGSKDIFVIGFNADQIALDAIKNGDMAATIQQVPVEMGKMTVALATKLMNGEKLTYDNADAREIFVPVNLITPEALGVVAKPVTKKVVGFSVYDMQYGFFQDMEKGTHEAATAAGYDYILVDEKSSESTMVSATIDLINQGISALIISPFKPDALGPIVDAAKAKGIPVVVEDIGGRHRLETVAHRVNLRAAPSGLRRDRGDDVLLLAGHFLKMFRPAMNKSVDGLAPAARQKMLLHRWPGNVRELRNAIERALILETTREIHPSSLPDFQIETRLTKRAQTQPVPNESLDDALTRTEREVVALRVLLEMSGASSAMSRRSRMYAVASLSARWWTTIRGVQPPSGPARSSSASVMPVRASRTAASPWRGRSARRG
jgi:ribose transport system substrate-binding protein